MTLKLFKFKGFSPNHLEVRCLRLDTSSFYHPDPIHPPLFVLPEVDTSWPHSWPSRQTSPFFGPSFQDSTAKRMMAAWGQFAKSGVCRWKQAKHSKAGLVWFKETHVTCKCYQNRACPRIQATVQMSTHVYSKLRESTTDWPSLGWDANILVKFG